MGSLLHKLWDETVAGPAPEKGLGKLRKRDSISAVRSPPPPVTRSITVVKGNDGGGLRRLRMDPSRLSDPAAGSSNPGTPLTPGTPGDYFGPFDKNASGEADAPSLTAYEWIVINALDR